MDAKKKLSVCIFLLLFAVVIVLALNSDREVKISIVGDILLSRRVGEKIKTDGYDYPYEKIRDILNNDDITIGNLEGTITVAEAHALKKESIIFKSDEKNATALKKAGFEVLSLGNNHSMDYLVEGLKDTMHNLENAGIKYVGVNSGLNKDLGPCVIKKNGVRVGVLGYNTFPVEGQFFSDDDVRVASARIGYLEDMKKQIETAKKKCDYLIVYFHFGTEFKTEVSDKQKEYAHSAIDAGADLIVGAHPHRLQCMEYYKDRPIYYSLGSFVFDKFDNKPETDDSIILQVTIKNGEIEIDEKAIMIEKCQPYLVYGEDEKRIKNVLHPES